MDELEVKKDEEVSLALNRLSSLLETTIKTFEETRKKALDNHDYFKEMLKTAHELGSISEDGVLEKATNDSLRHVIESSRVLEQPIMAITRILTAKMALDAATKSAGKIVGPIDISSFK